ncbi:hypothetical protein [Cardinium endosymbiont of Tipula unca]|uniref:hypothetical protein n=1 Tax=Cardinium endosymbiont of Tipula unca TaxID=3066216 RepID=UPI0030CB2E1A
MTTLCKTKIDGSFVCMLANGAAMMVAHYLLPQPKDRGWVGEDNEMKQRKQAKERKKARRKEKITPLFTKDQLANLTPDKLRLTCIGAYILFTAFCSLILIKNDWFNYWNILLILIASSFIGLGFMRTVNTPSWSVGLHWVIGLFFCLSLNTIFHWWNIVDYSFTFMLSISYLIITLLFLPLALGSAIVAITILIILYPIY